MFESLEKLGVSVLMMKKFVNKNKLKILEMLEKKEKMSISEIQRELGISYKETYRHIKELTDGGMLSKEHNEKEKHQPVYISLNKKVLKF